MSICRKALAHKLHNFLTGNITAQSIHGRFASSVTKLKEDLDPKQEFALQEQCFLVDMNDKIIGTASKKECHLVKKDGSIPLHRAFSVFLFNNKGDLLLQKRANTKITYPNCYTNSCCSHPIADVRGEEEEKNALGIIRAAQRRMNHELGIDIKTIPVEKFKYLTRIHYMDTGNGKWGEHEIDYILFIQTDVKLRPNPNEVSEISFVPRGEFDSFIPALKFPLTPWFKLILKHKLHSWWDNLNDLNTFINHDEIISLKS